MREKVVWLVHVQDRGSTPRSSIKKIKGEKLGSVGNYAIEGIPPIHDLEIYTTNGKIEVE